MRESIPITGTPYSLNYRSETQVGYHPTISIPVTDGSLTSFPSTLKRIEAEIQVAGQDVILQGQLVTQPQTLQWSWDRTDAYGRIVQGSARANIEVRYVYDSVPMLGGSFAAYSDSVIGGNRATREVWVSRQYALDIGAFDDQQLGLGGWTISAAHIYQPTAGTLFLGTGEKYAPTQDPDVIHKYFEDDSATGIDAFTDIAVPADGNVYFIHSGIDFLSGYYFGKISSNAITKLTSTTTNNIAFTDGQTIGNVHLQATNSLIAEANGNLLIADKCRILRVTLPDQKVYLVAGRHDGTCTTGFAADGSAAVETALDLTYSLAELPDGSVIFLESSSNSRIRRVKNDGKLETLAGDGVNTPCAGCRPHDIVLVGTANPIAAGPDGTVYFSTFSSGQSDYRVWQISPRDGLVHLLAGTGTAGATGDGTLPPADAGLPLSTRENDVTISLDLYKWISVAGQSVLIPGVDDGVRKVDPNGLITTLAGVHGAPNHWYTDGVFANQANIIPQRVVLGPDGYYYTTSENEMLCKKGTGTMCGLPDQIVRFRRADGIPTGTSDLLVANPHGSEIYEFDSTGRHMLTRSLYSGATLLNLATGCSGSCYDGNGRLTALPDATNPALHTTITGYGTSTVTITSPNNQVTNLQLTGGYLTQITDPASAITKLTYDGSHRLSQLVEPNDAIDANHHTHNFTYTATGLLINDSPPGSDGTNLSRTFDPKVQASDSVAVSTPASRTTTHTVDDTLSSTDTYGPYLRTELRTHVDPVGLTVTDARYGDKTRKIVRPDSTTTINYTPDPRFGMSLPYASSVNVSTGTTHSLTTTVVRSAVDASSNPCTGFSCVTATTTTSNNVDLGSFTEKWSSSTTDCGTTTPCIVRTTAAGRTVIYTLDSLERPIEIAPQGTDPQLNPTCIIYGSSGYDNGQIVSVQQGSGVSCATGARTTTINHYSSSPYPHFQGFVSSIVAPRGTTSFYPLDYDGRPLTTSLPGSRNVVRTYDPNGNLTSLLEPNGSGYLHTFKPNALNLLGSYQPPPLTSYSNTDYDYDLDGLLLDWRPPTNTAVSYVRDAAGRVSQMSYNHPVSGSVTVSTYYDATTGKACPPAQPCTATNGPLAPVTTTDTYDGILLTKEETSLSSIDHWVNWTYDNAFRLQTRTLDGLACSGNSPCATFARDNDGLVKSVATTVNSNATLAISRSTTSNLVKCISLLGSCEVYSYNAFGEVTRATTMNGACGSSCSQTGTTTIYDVVYTRPDTTGRITTKGENLNGTSTTSYYSYDANNFLNCANTTGCGTPTWTYDADGNRSGLSYDTQDRSTDLTYTADGQVAGRTWTCSRTVPLQTCSAAYSYDPFDGRRRVAVSVNGSLNKTFDYVLDSQGRQVQRLTNSVSQGAFLYEGERVIAQIDASGALLAHFIYATKPNVPDLMLRLESGSWNVYRLISDQIGSVRAVVATNGTVAESYSWDGWGNTLGTTPTKQPFGFAGGLYDGALTAYFAGGPIYRFGARDYDASRGRWMSKDPIRFGGGLNLYAYCNNDPVNCSDPSGLMSMPNTEDESAIPDDGGLPPGGPPCASEYVECQIVERKGCKDNSDGSRTGTCTYRCSCGPKSIEGKCAPAEGNPSDAACPAQKQFWCN